MTADCQHVVDRCLRVLRVIHVPMPVYVPVQCLFCTDIPTMAHAKSPRHYDFCIYVSTFSEYNSMQVRSCARRPALISPTHTQYSCRSHSSSAVDMTCHIVLGGTVKTAVAYGVATTGSRPNTAADRVRKLAAEFRARRLLDRSIVECIPRVQCAWHVPRARSTRGWRRRGGACAIDCSARGVEPLQRCCVFKPPVRSHPAETTAHRILAIRRGWCRCVGLSDGSKHSPRRTRTATRSRSCSLSWDPGHPSMLQVQPHNALRLHSYSSTTRPYKATFIYIRRLATARSFALVRTLSPSGNTDYLILQSARVASRHHVVSIKPTRTRAAADLYSYKVVFFRRRPGCLSCRRRHRSWFQACRNRRTRRTISSSIPRGQSTSSS
jgi:hypothetical protein